MYWLKKETFFQLENQILLYTVEKKGHLNLILHHFVTCYLLPENFHLSNFMRRPSEDKKFLNKSFITIEHITLLQ